MKFYGNLAQFFGIMSLLGCIATCCKSDWQLASSREIAAILWFMLSVMFFKWEEAKVRDAEIEKLHKEREEDDVRF